MGRPEAPKFGTIVFRQNFLKEIPTVDISAAGGEQ
jgi:hypothetical protein